MAVAMTLTWDYEYGAWVPTQAVLVGTGLSLGGGYGALDWGGGYSCHPVVELTPCPILSCLHMSLAWPSSAGIAHLDPVFALGVLMGCLLLPRFGEQPLSIRYYNAVLVYKSELNALALHWFQDPVKSSPLLLHLKAVTDVANPTPRLTHTQSESLPPPITSPPTNATSRLFFFSAQPPDPNRHPSSASSSTHPRTTHHQYRFLLPIAIFLAATRVSLVAYLFTGPES